MADDEPGFVTSDRKGFHITFENGCTVSVQFGYGNYGSNRDWRGGHRNDGVPKARTAEVAAWHANGDWIKVAEDDDVAGWQSPAEVLAIMSRVAAMPRADTQA